MATISKTVRIPEELISFIDHMPGDNFSDRLIFVIREFSQVYEKHKIRTDKYIRLSASVIEALEELKDITDWIQELDQLDKKILAHIQPDVFSDQMEVSEDD